MNINDAQAVFGCVVLTKMSKWSKKVRERRCSDMKKKPYIKWQKTNPLRTHMS